jgi:hypothetical protein
MLLLGNQTGSRRLAGTAPLLAALLAFSSGSARGQYPVIYEGDTPGITSPTPTTDSPAAAAEADWHSFGVDQLLDQILRLQQQRSHLERQQKEAEAVLAQKLRLQQEQIRKLGIMDAERTRPMPSAVKPK